ncbi:uncharacterized protein LOC124349992 [Daphnia pulicaria]|uniref:uncharacterized protein LOC124349992 n=1 Tax=Daphnia pulicaria TaxID=35523 RepID=UPI001EEC978B|nr:uncharacterized protein LOC124349992 [Daphnia pulicaria]XP_046656913.1 uncharacterized protein LOC124349992 [Daphnia pulicaria]
MIKLQQKVDQLVYEAIAREKLISQSQVTLDEKQKRIGELEGSLNDKTKKVVELEKAISKAGRVLQGFVIDLQKKEKELEQLKIEATLKRQKMDPLTAPVKKCDKRNINENEFFQSENPTPDVHKLSNGVAQVHSAGAGPPRDSFVIVGKKNVHFNEARVAKFYVQSVSIEAHNSSKKIIELDICIGDSKEFGMLDERGSSVSRLLLKVESGKKIYL